MSSENALTRMVTSDVTKKRIVDALEGSGITPEQFILPIVAELNKSQSGLAQCSQFSIYAALMNAAQFQLVPNGALGHCYIVPYKKVATFVLGYKGAVDLLYRTAQITVSAQVLYDQDQFDYQLGTDPRITHRPEIIKPRGEIIAAYAIFTLPTGKQEIELMTKADLMKIEQQGAYKGADSPWTKWREEMLRKAPIKRGAKKLPLSNAAARAFHADNLSEVGEIALPEGMTGNEEQEAKEQAQRLSAKLDTASPADQAIIEEGLAAFGENPFAEPERVEALRDRAQTKFQVQEEK